MYRDQTDREFERAIEAWWNKARNGFDSQEEAEEYLRDLLDEVLDGYVEDE